MKTVNLKLDAYCGDDFISPDQTKIKLTEVEVKKLITYLDTMQEMEDRGLAVYTMEIFWDNITFTEEGEELNDFEYPTVAVFNGWIKFKSLSKYTDHYVSTDIVPKEQLVALLKKFKKVVRK